MSDWAATPYPLGPPVPLPGFPRPLYPPDADRRPPATDGPDVVAYKRIVSRAGRWPWQQFDDTYSNAFAHGKGPAAGVGSTGVAGVQRQAGIEPASGFIGPRTFLLLARIIIPAPLSHAGEYACDANAQTLLAEAYYQLHEPPPAPPTVREQALELARDYLGLTEEPTGSNRTPFGKWYGMDGVPWCAIFATYCYELGAKGGSPTFARGQTYAYVPYIVADAQKNRHGLTVTLDPQPGDLVAYDWDGGDYDHVGLFESGDRHTFTAVEGNTSLGNNSNGGQVMRRLRRRTDAQRVTFVRVAEP
jgi:hypothetical protein